MWQVVLSLGLLCIMWPIQALAEPARAAYPSANVQFLPAFVSLEKGFYRREGFEPELISVRNAVTAVQALIGNQIHFIFSVGPQMPSIWEGSDIVLLAQQVGRPTFSMVVAPDIQKVADLKGKKIGVSFGGSTFAGTKALLELNKMNPEKDVQYVSIPGSMPKVAAMQQGIISAALLAPPAEFVKRMVRAIVRGVYHTRDNPEDAIQVMMKHLRMERDASADAYQLIREALNPIPTEKGVELMAQWQAVALNTKPKRKPSEYMDLKFVNEVVAELGQK